MAGRVAGIGYWPARYCSRARYGRGRGEDGHSRLDGPRSGPIEYRSGARIASSGARPAPPPKPADVRDRGDRSRRVTKFEPRVPRLQRAGVRSSRPACARSRSAPTGGGAWRGAPVSRSRAPGRQRPKVDRGALCPYSRPLRLSRGAGPLETARLRPLHGPALRRAPGGRSPVPRLTNGGGCCVTLSSLCMRRTCRCEGGSAPSLKAIGPHAVSRPERERLSETERGSAERVESVSSSSWPALGAGGVSVGRLEAQQDLRNSRLKNPRAEEKERSTGARAWGGESERLVKWHLRMPSSNGIVKWRQMASSNGTVKWHSGPACAASSAIVILKPSVTKAGESCPEGERKGTSSQ